MKVNEVYPQTTYLKADDLQKPVKVKIATVTVRTFTDQKTNEEQKRIVLSFDKATRVMTCNRTQAYSVTSALGTDDTDQWPGREIILSAGLAHNGYATIIVSPVVTDNGEPDNPFN